MQLRQLQPIRRYTANVNISDQILNDMVIHLLQLVITMRHCDTITHGWRNIKVSRYESTVKKAGRVRISYFLQSLQLVLLLTPFL